MHRAVNLTDDQWNRVKARFIRFVLHFFPNNCMLPVFVPLNGNVLAKLEELQQEIEELQHAPAAADDAAAEVPPAPPAAPPARDVHNRPRPPPHVQDERPQKKRRHIDGWRSAIDMDGDMQVEEKKKVKEEREVQWELVQP